MADSWVTARSGLGDKQAAQSWSHILGIIVFESMLPVVLIIFAGLFLRLFDIVSEKHWVGIELLSYWLLFPILLLTSLINMDLSRINLGAVTKSYLLAIIVQMAIIWLLRHPLRRYLKISDRTYSSIFQTATRWNAFMALAIADNLAGDQGMAIVALIMAITVPIFNVINILVLTVCCSDEKPTITRAVVNTMKVPLIWGALLGLLLNLAHVPIYEPLMVTFDVVGRAGLGIGLLTVGAGLHLKVAFKARNLVFIGVVARLLLFPLLVFTTCMIFGVSGATLQIVMLCASVATAMNGYVLARQMGGDADLYAATASFQVVISMLTLPLILWLVQSASLQ